MVPVKGASKFVLVSNQVKNFPLLAETIKTAEGTRFVFNPRRLLLKMPNSGRTLKFHSIMQLCVFVEKAGKQAANLNAASSTAAGMSLVYLSSLDNNSCLLSSQYFANVLLTWQHSARPRYILWLGETFLQHYRKWYNSYLPQTPHLMLSPQIHLDQGHRIEKRCSKYCILMLYRLHVSFSCI